MGSGDKQVTLEEIKEKLLSGQVVFNEIKVKIKSTRHDQYYAEITHPKHNIVISNYHPQSGLNVWHDHTFTGTLNQICEKTAFYIKHELFN